ncbi:MAG TPA: DJ-1/PfpI family protein [Candidatus Limnocylindrales bacterium]|nr:DJ-1/PfpI family protein [Candidatus Limnocylindrales bacterium]
MSPQPRHPRRIVMVTFPQAEMLDVVGPLEVFSVASRFLEQTGRTSGPAYIVEIVAQAPGRMTMASGLQIVASRSLRGVRGPIDTLFVPGGEGTNVAMRDAVLIDWIRRTARTTRRVASVCTGAFLLARAGLLSRKRATTHWRFCDRLAAEHPDVQVEPDSIYVRDGRVFTSAGVTAGMDLALALVEDDYGKEVALTTARLLVLFLKRPGGQSQFSTQLASQFAEREPIRDLQAWIIEHPEADLSVEALARRVAMSPRNFARVFTREVGATPARFVERVRVEAARRRLEQAGGGVEEVAAGCGFGTAETMRRAFLRNVQVSPSAYRARFRTEKSHGDLRSPV